MNKAPYATVFVSFLRGVFHARWLLLQLAWRDFKTRYIGSYISFLWAFIHPAITVLVFWFVFQVGFKVRPVNDVPFALWLVCGIVPWFYFADSWSGGTGSLGEYSFLVKKVVFRTSLLPIIKILSGLPVHLAFILIMLAGSAVYGPGLSIYNLQIIYYFAGMVILLLGLCWLTSSMVLFLKDIGQAISVILQFGFWATPIFWSIDLMPHKYQQIIKLNPMFYITNGYRSAMLERSWFWEHWLQASYFWLGTMIIFVAGAVVFHRLRPHFADVL